MADSSDSVSVDMEGVPLGGKVPAFPQHFKLSCFFLYCGIFCFRAWFNGGGGVLKLAFLEIFWVFFFLCCQLYSIDFAHLKRPI